MFSDKAFQQVWETDAGKKARQQFADLETDEGKKAHHLFADLQPRVNRMLDAVRRSETLGDMGWAFPLDMSFDDHVHIVEQSTSYEKADAAFLKYYTDNDGEAYERLMDLLIDDGELQECKTLLEEVRQSYADGRFRVCVCALLPVLDHIAQKNWDAPFGDHSNANKSLERKIGVLPDSFTDYFWRSIKAFVDRVFEGAGKSKPPTLNRHWILHGRGISDGTQLDSLRLLQAIRTLGRLIDIGKFKPT
jgi:hypothetical protein